MKECFVVDFQLYYFKIAQSVALDRLVPLGLYQIDQ